VLAGIRSISETRRCWAKAKSGWRRSCSISFPAPGADGSAAVAPRGERLSRALPPYKQPRRFEIATICRARRLQGPAQQAPRATAARSALTRDLIGHEIDVDAPSAAVAKRHNTMSDDLKFQLR